MISIASERNSADQGPALLAWTSRNGIEISTLARTNMEVTRPGSEPLFYVILTAGNLLTINWGEAMKLAIIAVCMLGFAGSSFAESPDIQYTLHAPLATAQSRQSYEVNEFIFFTGFEPGENIPIHIDITTTYRLFENQPFDIYGNISTESGVVVDASISGPDDSFFELLSASTAGTTARAASLEFLLTLKEERDYENPLDSNNDNIYDIFIEALNGNSRTYKPVQVIVDNFDEDIIDLQLVGTDSSYGNSPTLGLNLVIDNLTEAESVSVLYWQGEKQYWTSAQQTYRLPLKTTFDGVFELPATAPSGLWEIRTIVIRTPYGEMDFPKSLLESKGFDVSTYVNNELADNNDPELIDIGEFEIIGNDGDPATSIVARLEATVFDVENALSRAGGYLQGPNYDGGWGIVWSWGSITSNANPSIVEFNWHLHPKTSSGIYQIEDLRFYDSAGNQSLYSGGSISALGDYTFNLQNPISDDIAPELTDFQMTPSVDSDSGRKMISIRTQIDNGADQETPIKRQYIRLSGPAGLIDSDNFALQSDRYYQLDILLPQEAPDGDYSVSYWFIADSALNDNKLSSFELVDLGYQTTVSF